VTTPEVAIVVSPRGWAEALHRFVADHGGARVRARVLDAREALDERYQVLVAEDLTSFLTPKLIGDLHRRGRRVLGVHDPAEPWGRERLLELGVDEVVPATLPPEELLQAVAALGVAAGTDLDAELERLTGPDAPASAVSDGGGGAPVPRGHRVVVSGPAGGPGVTEVALALAHAIAADGRAVLVDLDDVAPSLAQRLALPLHPNLRTALDAVQHGDADLADVLAPLGRLEVLAGLPHAPDAAELRPHEVADLLDELRRRGHVAVDAGHRLEDHHGRHAVVRSAVSGADLHVVVGAPTPVGVTRLLAHLADLRALSSAPVHVAVNRAPSDRFRVGEVRDEVVRTFVPASLTVLPADRRVEQAAWDGAVVGAGPFTKAVRGLVHALRTGREVAA
jgi:MinD-like ATPase involved in chromosome partitioning or flagellar assembly